MAARFEEETSLMTAEGGSQPNYSTIGSADSRRSSMTSQPDPSAPFSSAPLSVEELQFRFKYMYCFLDRSYTVEHDVSALLSTKTDVEREIAVEQILQDLNKSPLHIQQKLAITRFLKERTGKGRARTKEKEVKKKREMFREIHSFHLWEGPITKTTAYFGSNVASYFRFLRTLFYLNILSALLMVGLVTVPQLLSGEDRTGNYVGHFGELSDSILFYGAYTDHPMKDYNLQLAYFLTWVGENIGYFLILITLMLVRYRQSKMAEKGDEYKFAWKTFCTWDHTVTTHDGVKDQTTAIRTNMKEIVREEKSTMKIPTAKRLLFYLGRLISNLLVLGLQVGSGLLIYYVATNAILPDTAPESIKDFFNKYQLTAVVAGLKFLVPPVFVQVVKLEGWAPRVEAKWTLARTTLFYLASLIVFAQTLIVVADDRSRNDQNGTVSTVAGESVSCWENEVAEEVFKVVLLDLAICIAVGLCFQAGRAAAIKCGCCSKKFGYSTFNVVSCVLDLIYGQGLIWLGLYFSPLMAVVAVAKLLVVFYFRYVVARVAMVPEQQLFRASSTGNFYLAILLCTLFTCLFPMAYALIETTPSSDCGPFRMQDRAYSVVSDLIGNLPDWLDDGLTYISNEAIIVSIIFLLILIGIYYKSKASSYANLIAELRNQLKFERRVEKRKVFATGRAMSAVTISKTSMTSLDQIPETPTSNRKVVIHGTIEENEEFYEELDHIHSDSDREN